MMASNGGSVRRSAKRRKTVESDSHSPIVLSEESATDSLDTNNELKSDSNNNSQRQLISTQLFDESPSPTTAIPCYTPSASNPPVLANSAITAEDSPRPTPISVGEEELSMGSHELKGELSERLVRMCGECKTLSKDLSNEKWIQCSHCRLFYHISCAAIKPKVYDLIHTTRTIKWICLECLHRQSVDQNSLLNII